MHQIQPTWEEAGPFVDVKPWHIVTLVVLLLLVALVVLGVRALVRAFDEGRNE